MEKTHLATEKSCKQHAERPNQEPAAAVPRLLSQAIIAFQQYCVFCSSIFRALAQKIRLSVVEFHVFRSPETKGTC